MPVNKKNEPKRERWRTVMYVQQLAYLPGRANATTPVDEDEAEKLIAGLRNRLEDAALANTQFEYALIVHDDDPRLDENGNMVLDDNDVVVTVEPHVHVIARTAPGAGKSPHGWGDLFMDKPERVTRWTNSGWDNAIAYIVHETLGASAKVQYDPADVIANFDFVAALDKAQKNVKANASSVVANALLQYDSGALSLDQAAAGLVGEDKVKFLRQAKVLREYKDSQVIRNENGISVTYIFGEPGSGKTRLAKELAGESRFITGTNRDPFAGFKPNVETVIIDDIRAKMFEAGELLRLLDRYADNRMAPARYRDANLNAVKQVILTYYGSPFEFWQAYSDEPFEQFRRRLDHVYHVINDGSRWYYEDETTREQIDTGWQL